MRWLLKNEDSFGKAIVQQPDNTFAAIADIDTLGYTLTDLADQQDVATKRYVDNANRTVVYGAGRFMAVGDVSMDGRRISNLGHPLQPHEVATKFYVDNGIESVKTYSSSGEILKIQREVFPFLKTLI